MHWLSGGQTQGRPAAQAIGEKHPHPPIPEVASRSPQRCTPLPGQSRMKPAAGQRPAWHPTGARSADWTTAVSTHAIPHTSSANQPGEPSVSTCQSSSGAIDPLQSVGSCSMPLAFRARNWASDGESNACNHRTMSSRVKPQKRSCILTRLDQKATRDLTTALLDADRVGCKASESMWALCNIHDMPCLA